jgi:hypothetical protein
VKQWKRKRKRCVEPLGEEKKENEIKKEEDVMVVVVVEEEEVVVTGGGDGDGGGGGGISSHNFTSPRNLRHSGHFFNCMCFSAVHPVGDDLDDIERFSLHGSAPHATMGHATGLAIVEPIKSRIYRNKQTRYQQQSNSMLSLPVADKLHFGDV